MPFPFGPPQGESGTPVGTATASDVLTGETFSSAVAGSGASGTMPNQGSPTLQPGAAITAGYYSGGSVASPGSGSQTFTTPGKYDFTVPSGVTRVNAACWGAGGSSAAGNAAYPQGGGGGAFTLGTLDVSPGQSLSVVVGAGGAEVTGTEDGISGENSSVTDPSSGAAVTALGGGGGVYSSSPGANNGGISTGANILTSIPGGIGGTGGTSPDDSGGGGGGAGSGGPGGNGQADGGVGGSGGPDGGIGGGGEGAQQNVTAAAAPGGGGACTGGGNGHVGASGQVKLFW